MAPRRHSRLDTPPDPAQRTIRDFFHKGPSPRPIHRKRRSRPSPTSPTSSTKTLSAAEQVTRQARARLRPSTSRPSSRPPSVPSTPPTAPSAPKHCRPSDGRVARRLGSPLRSNPNPPLRRPATRANHIPKKHHSAPRPPHPAQQSPNHPTSAAPVSAPRGPVRQSSVSPAAQSTPTVTPPASVAPRHCKPPSPTILPSSSRNPPSSSPSCTSPPILPSASNALKPGLSVKREIPLCKRDPVAMHIDTTSTSTPSQLPTPTSTPPRRAATPTDMSDDDDDDNNENGSPVNTPASPLSPAEPGQPLTQEELDVHDQLQSLECSQDRMVTSSPAKPSASGTDNRRFAFASGATDGDVTPPHPAVPSSPSSIGSPPLPTVLPQRVSTRTSRSVERFDPSAGTGRSAFGNASVFRGGGLFGNGSVFSSSRPGGRAGGNLAALDRIVRNVRTMENREEKVHALRQDVADDKADIDKEEKQLQDFANEETELEKSTIAAQRKYSAPLPLFCGKRMRQSSREIEEYNGVLVDLLRCVGDVSSPSADIALSYIASTGLKMVEDGVGVADGRSQSSSSRTSFRRGDVHMLYDLTVHDESPIEVGRISRDNLFELLLHMLTSSSAERLPTLTETLTSYGALQLRDAYLNGIPASPATSEEPESLEQAVDKDGGDPAVVLQAARNLSRSILLASRLIELGCTPQVAFGVTSSSNASMCDGFLQAIGLCVRILLSPFGSRLSRPVGQLLEVVLDSIHRDHWPDARLAAAKHMLSFSTGLELHVELVTFLLPYHTRRTLQLSMEVAFLSLTQWGRGPGKDPQPRPVDNFQPSTAARALGIQTISYCVGDVLALVAKIPNPEKDTDIVWARGVARLIKQTVAMPDVLRRRTGGEVKTLMSYLTTLRQCSQRMAFDVPVQDFRLALDAVIRSVRELCALDRETRAEVMPAGHDEKRQTTFSVAAQDRGLVR